jgi:hypothetical protein
MKQKTQEDIIKTATEKWIKKNKGLFTDYQKICGDIIMFRIKWGIELELIFKKPKGRDLEKGVVEKLFK